MGSFFSELRRRNVLRLAATYALVAWILIEAGSVLLPTFGVPEWFFRAYVLVIFAGFVVALILAWVFELTPEGVKLESRIDRDTRPHRAAGRSNAIIIALLVVALGVSITFNVTGLRSVDDEPAAASSGEMPSIAVLPFTSRSTDPDNRYFADGIHDDLLMRLADIGSLRVISRTSVNEYRDTTRNLREIGSELGVDTIVEGAVQRSGDQVRITVQLIDAVTDEHLWADSYDRELTTRSLFEIQSEISSQIASALKAALTPEEELRLAAIPTKSLEALSQYSAARQNLYLRRFDTLIDARRQFERAIELDPEYAQAYAGLAETLLVTLANHRSIDPDEAFELASAAIARALEIDPELAEAHAVDGLLKVSRWSVTRVGSGDKAAARSFERAIQLNPNLSVTYVWYASLREAEDDLDGAIELLTRAMRVDPLGRIPYVNLPGHYAAKGKPEKALQLLVRAMDIFPDWPMPYLRMADHLMSLGRLDEAIAWSMLATAMTDDPLAGGSALGAYLEFGLIERIRSFGAQFPEDHPFYRMGAGYLRFTEGDYRGAIDDLDELQGGADVKTKFAFPLIAMSAIILRDFGLAEDYLIRANPVFASDTADTIDRHNLQQAIMLAFVYKELGQNRRADRMLDEASRVVGRMHRIGVGGYGISDVQIFLLQGRRDAALDAMRDAIDEGFVSLIAYTFWTLDQDPLIATLRDDERFQAMKRELDQKIDAMRRNVERAEDSGDWSELLERVRSTALTAAVATP